MMKIIFLITFLIFTITSFCQETEEYYDNNSIKCVYYLKDNKKHGKYKEYYKNGNIKIIGKYKNRKEIGHWKVYVESGQLLKELWYNRKGEWVKSRMINIAYK